jgi:hypothetical protein
MEAPPSTAFEVSQPHLLLELLIVALNAPAQLGEVNQFGKGDFFGKRRQPVLGRLALVLRPLDQQSFLRSPLGAPFVAMRGANPQAGKARAQRLGRALAPCNRAPSRFRQAERQRLDRDRSVLGVAPHQLRRPPATHHVFAGNGRASGGHTVVVDRMPAA